MRVAACGHADLVSVGARAAGRHERRPSPHFFSDYPQTKQGSSCFLVADPL